MRIKIASIAERPTAQEVPNLDDREARDLVDALLLLTKGAVQWRLEALSELQALAVDHKNIVAKAILDPKLSAGVSAKE